MYSRPGWLTNHIFFKYPSDEYLMKKSMSVHFYIYSTSLNVRLEPKDAQLMFSSVMLQTNLLF